MPETKFPAHKCSMTITHNYHRDMYQTVAQWVQELESRGGEIQWKDDAAKQRSIETNQMWELQWYPDTPIGFYVAAAPTFGEVIALALEMEGASFMTNEELKIRTSEIRPPIPILSMDWVAWIDGREQDGPTGYGKTEAEAIADLKENLE